MFTITLSAGEQRLDKSEFYRTFEKPFELNEYDRGILNQAPDDLSFCIADLKYNVDTLKILEFGEGGRSKFKGYDALFGPGMMWALFWSHLAQFQVPIWLVSMPEDPELLREINYDLFCKIGGKRAETITELQKKIDADIQEQHGIVTDQHRADYSAIVLIKKGRPTQTVNAMKGMYQKIVFIGQFTNKYVNNKFRLDSLFTSPELKKYRPLCRSCSVEYDSNLAQSLIKDFGCDVFVIKPINSSRGRGIIMVAKDQLDFTFKLILKDRAALKRTTLPEEYTYWQTYQSPIFLVEAYEPSKPVFIDDKPYDATMRLVFTLDYKDGKLDVTIFDGYWKLPAFPLTDATCSLTEKHKSHIIPGLLSSVRISEEDKAGAKKLLEDALYKLYWQMVQSRMFTFDDEGLFSIY